MLSINQYLIAVYHYLNALPLDRDYPPRVTLSNVGGEVIYRLIDDKLTDLLQATLALKTLPAGLTSGHPNVNEYVRLSKLYPLKPFVGDPRVYRHNVKKLNDTLKHYYLKRGKKSDIRTTENSQKSDIRTDKSLTLEPPKTTKSLTLEPSLNDQKQPKKDNIRTTEKELKRTALEPRPLLDQKLYKQNLNVRTQRRQVENHVNLLYEKHARLLVIRVDLYYADTLEKQDISLAKKTLSRYLRSIRKVLTPIETLAWFNALEYGNEQGYHNHLAIVLNGNVHRSDIDLAITLGKAWVKLTEGTYHYCNGKPYPNYGIGVVSHTDTVKRANLIKALNYLNKDNTNDLTYVVIPKGEPTFSRSNEPVVNKTKRGRPRKHEIRTKEF